MTPNTAPLAPITLPPIAIAPGPNAGKPPAPAEWPTPDEAAVEIVLFGRDDRGRAHAAKFAAGDTNAATAAAAVMNLHILRVTSVCRPLAAGLPKGRLFDSGRALVPFCSARMFADLLAAAGLPDAPMPVKAAGKPAEAPSGPASGQGGGAAAGGAGGAAKPPFDWDDITLGSVVLAKGDDEDGYYAAKVIATKADQHFVLRWVDYPDLMEFSRHRLALGLLHPGTPMQGK